MGPAMTSGDDGGTDVKLRPSAEERAALDEWLEDRPQVIQEMARKYPPWHCYRHPPSGPHGHYVIYSYAENGSVTLIHGSDSFLPAMQVFGIPADDLVVCDCGQWRNASAAQAFATDARIRAAIAERDANKGSN